jgi:hypothetical protein
MIVYECAKCHEKFCNQDYPAGSIFQGIDEHHNPPKFLTGEKEWNDFEGRQFLNLCREHHRELHDEIIVILNRVAKTLKCNKSEHWVCQKMSPAQKKEATKEVFEYTKRWLSQKNSK